MEHDKIILLYVFGIVFGLPILTIIILNVFIWKHDYGGNYTPYQYLKFYLKRFITKKRAYCKNCKYRVPQNYDKDICDKYIAEYEKNYFELKTIVKYPLCSNKNRFNTCKDFESKDFKDV